jgi:hypothetical protein
MAKRQSVNFPGFAHQNPIPNASRIGNVMMSSVISGVDPGTRNMPPELAKQVSNLYRGRDGHYWPPPAQIRTRPTKASGSYLGCLTSKRSSGQG